MLTRLIFFILIINNLAESYTFNEQLTVNLLPNSHTYFFFEFKSIWPKTLTNNIENYDLYPKQLGDIVSKFDIDELSLTLSQGKWKYNEWSLPLKSAPSGSELWTVFRNDLPEKIVNSNWLQSSRAISGLFGLSINLDENPNTVIPKYSIVSNTNNTRYASIPNEIVCTENLTPWIKLLPCGKNNGLAQLLRNAPKLFESHYFMASLHFKRKCSNELCQFELKQTLSLVYNIDIITRQLDKDEITWSLNNVFQNKITKVCPVSDTSNVVLNLEENGRTTVLPTQKNNQVYIFDLKKVLSNSNDFNPSIVQKKDIKLSQKAPLLIHRYITDKNEINFGIKTLIKNENDNQASIVYFDTIPWYFRVYISSLEIKDESNNQIIKPDSIHFVPGLDRQKPHHIELKLTLKPKTAYSILYRADFAYLKWDEFPPDVNHGFYINPALITINTNTQMYSETLLMNLPTPDFSMPYNVICLTCTVIAIGFGSLHNFTTRKFKFLPSKTLKDKVITFISKLKK